MNGPRKIAFTLIILLFFMWGFITVLNDILIPHWKAEFALSNFSSMLVNFAFFIAYFLGALGYYLYGLWHGDPINKIGYKNGILIGLISCTVGSLLFIPAAQVNIFGIHLIGLFIIGLGFTLLQITCNPYVTILGTPDGASSRLNFAQGINSLGTTLSPIIGGYLIFQYFDPGNEVQYTYLIFALIFAALAIIIKLTKFPEFKNEEQPAKGWSVLKLPQVRWGMLAIFFYVGAEATIGSKIVELLALDSFGGIRENVAKNYVGLYWGGAMVGRFIGFIAFEEAASIVKKILKMFGIGILFIIVLMVIQLIQGYLLADQSYLSISELWPLFLFIPIHIVAALMGRFLPGRVLSLFALINIGLLTLCFLFGRSIGIWSIVGIGFFNSIMWSNIFTLSIQGLGSLTTQASSFLVMMILGGALLPLAFGGVADILSLYTFEPLRYAYLLPIISYLVLAVFGIQKFKTNNL